MAVNLTLTLTLNGRDALWNSGNTGVKLDITHLQFGARNRLTTGEESFLNQPKQYTQIQNGSKIGPDQVRIMATMPGVENYNVAEIGLWSGEPGLVGSILIAYVSVATGFIVQMVLGIDLVFTYDMVISTVDIDYVNIIKDTDQSSTFALLADHEVDRNAHPYYLTTDTEQTVSGTKTFTSKAIFSSGLSGELDGNAASATKLATARSIGGVNFDGTANINLPGVNETGNQNTSGNAATATRLANARTINEVAFNGTANITVFDDTKLPTAGGTITGDLTVKGDVLTSGDFTTSNKSIAITGYTPLTNGVILQWGKALVAGDSDLTITFPIAFPGAFLSAQASLGMNDWSVRGDAGCGAHSATKTGMVLRNGHGGSGDIFWLAIGN